MTRLRCPPDYEIEKAFVIAISQYGLPTRNVRRGFCLFRTQDSQYSDPVYYNRNSDTRYGDAHREIGVCYVACSDVVAVAETLQNGLGGPNTPVRRREIESLSLHRLRTTRVLTLVDALGLASNTGTRLDTLVQAKGQGSEGYKYTQALSAVCMRHGKHIDGLLYPSRAYPSSGQLSGCNIVLFEGRDQQLSAISCDPLIDIELSTAEVVGEFLARIQVPIA